MKPDPKYIVGVNLSHDSSICLLKDGIVLNATSLERTTGIKHYQCGPRSNKTLLKAVSALLYNNKVSWNDCSLVVENPNGGLGGYPHLITGLPIKKGSILAMPAPSHHTAHAYSSFFCSPFNESAVYVCDTYGSLLENAYVRESETAFMFSEENQSTVERKTRGPGEINIGRFYDMITNLIGFSSGTGGHLGSLGEGGKTMALAPFGKERPDFPNFSRDYLSKNSISCADWQGLLLEQGLLSHEFDKKTLRRNFPEDIPWKARIRQKSEPLTQLHKDLAHLAQKTLEDKILFDLAALRKKTGAENICLAGGTFLNCTLNRKILEAAGFKKVFVQPAATDDGNAIGCAMYGYHKLSKSKPKRRVATALPFFGITYMRAETERAIQRFLKEPGSQKTKKPRPTAGACAKIASNLAKGKFIGLFIGGSEFGPRALGHRSILADPRRQELKERLNLMKGREAFRPFAPAVLDEFADDYFHLPPNSRLLTRYMLMAARAREDKKALIPAVLHVDGTARLQTVTEAQNRGLYGVIKEFHRITGVPLVLNTSLNFKGRPIVETPSDALGAFFESGLDYLFIEPFLIKKRNKGGGTSLKIV